MYTFLNLNSVYIIHGFLLIFLLESIFFKNFNILFFENIKSSVTNYNSFTFKNPLNLKFSLDTFYIFLLYNINNNLEFVELPLNFLIYSFTNEIYSFLHTMNIDYIAQILCIGSVVNLNLIYIIDISLPNLIFFFIIITFFYFKVFKNFFLIII
jgi:hypothetical protein